MIKNKGFSLLESMIAIAIFTAIFTYSMKGTGNLIKITTKTSISQHGKSLAYNIANNISDPSNRFPNMKIGSDKVGRVTCFNKNKEQLGVNSYATDLTKNFFLTCPRFTNIITIVTWSDNNLSVDIKIMYKQNTNKYRTSNYNAIISKAF